MGVNHSGRKHSFDANGEGKLKYSRILLYNSDYFLLYIKLIYSLIILGGLLSFSEHICLLCK